MYCRCRKPGFNIFFGSMVDLAQASRRDCRERAFRMRAFHSCASSKPSFRWPKAAPCGRFRFLVANANAGPHLLNPMRKYPAGQACDTFAMVANFARSATVSAPTWGRKTARTIIATVDADEPVGLCCAQG